MRQTNTYANTFIFFSFSFSFLFHFLLFSSFMFSFFFFGFFFALKCPIYKHLFNWLPLLLLHVVMLELYCWHISCWCHHHYYYHFSCHCCCCLFFMFLLLSTLLLSMLNIYVLFFSLPPLGSRLQRNCRPCRTCVCVVLGLYCPVGSFS